MDALAILHALLAGFCFYAAIVHLMIGIRSQPHNPVHLSFGLSALLVGSYIFTIIGLQSAMATASGSLFGLSSKLNHALVFLFAVAYVWFIALYTHVRPRKALIGLSIFYGAMTILILSAPLQIAEPAQAWNFSYLPYAPPVKLLLALTLIPYVFVYFIFSTYAAIKQYRRGERDAARVLMLAMAIFQLSAIVDLIVFGWFPDTIPFAQFGFVAFILLMSVQLSGQTVRAEQAVRQLNIGLEDRVAARTAELHQEISEREQMAAMLQTRTGELHERLNELSAINQIGQIIAVTTELDEMLLRVAELMTDLFSVRAVFISVLDDKTHQVQKSSGFEVQNGPYFPTNSLIHLADMPISRRVLATGKSAAVEGVQALPLSAPVRTIVTPLSVQTMLITPLKTHGKIIGLLTLASDAAERCFTSQEFSLAETISDDVAGAIESARLTEQARLAAVDAERHRLARELHDSVTQSLYSLTLLSSGWKSMAEQGTLTDPAASFRRLGDVGQQALKEMRLLIHQLRPAEMEELGLAQSLQRRLDAVELRAGIEPQLCIEGEVEHIPDPLADQLFFIAQEALNNSLRHAQATQVRVHLQVAEQRVRLEIKDNGSGFDPDAESAGMGLVTMRERAQSFGGDVTFESAPAVGSAVIAFLPLRHAAREETPLLEEQV